MLKKIAILYFMRKCRYCAYTLYLDILVVDWTINSPSIQSNIKICTISANSDTEQESDRKSVFIRGIENNTIINDIMMLLY